MIALVRSRVVSQRVVPAMVQQCSHECAASSFVRLTAWTRDEAVGAVLFHAPLPAVAALAVDGTTKGVGDHLLADSEEAESSWLSVADVVVREEEIAVEGTGERQLSRIFERFPGCLIAAVFGAGNACAVGSRDGWSTRVVGRPAHGKIGQIFAWYASLAHVWRTSGRSLGDLADAYVTVSVHPDEQSHGRVIAVIGSNA
jgi:hypothetical protein